MEELLYIHQSLQESQVADALLHRCLNFAAHRTVRLLHSLRWRLLLGLLSVDVNADNYTEEWIQSTRKHIEEWNNIHNTVEQRSRTVASVGQHSQKKICFGDSDSSDDDNNNNNGENVDNSKVENPLQPTAGGAYALRYLVDEIRTIALKDIVRLHWDLPLFEQENIKETLLNILVNYCLRHNCEYRQGMHEIAAFVLYLTHTDAFLIHNLSREDAGVHTTLLHTFTIVCPLEGVTALSFFIFESIMTSRGLNLSKWFYKNHADDSMRDDIVSAAHKVQGEFLERLDPVLHNQMNVVYSIEGTSYLIRWLRLLFLREFSLIQCADLWDVFLSERFLLGESVYNLSESTVTMFAAVMLLYVKSELMMDCIDALRRVMKYPPVEEIGPLVEMTIAHMRPQRNEMRRHFTPPENEQLQTLIQQQQQKERERKEEEGQQYNNNNNNNNNRGEENKEIEEERIVPKPTRHEMMNQQGLILMTIIENLEKHCFPRANLSPEETVLIMDNYVQSVAELKRVRDVLLSDIENNLYD
ncbi:rabGTPase-activating protein [Trypanosoma theileri]|uniref:RabGTPase-activating protein n=1 Tax=Trypanosoma theileri TaxID=67003 RepID=A0A1X0NSL3_9TRYP|nr:rabGTPase-activating protein [Trypanosoma theileri]ORC87696.1 rabGTPase-activating protein [Trypanosoma theileri]